MQQFKEGSFAAACYAQNSLAELDEIIFDMSQDDSYSDVWDCRTWDIPSQEWREAIRIAYDVKLEEAGRDDNAI